MERLWNRDAIDQVQITVAETGGMGTRGPFYDPVGALRDVLQNHLMQLLALLTMEPPHSFAADAIQDAKRNVLHAVRPLQPADAVRGQYARARNDGQALPAYREEPAVAQDLGAYIDRRVTLGLRPEHIHDREFPPPGVLPAALDATVEVLELMGNETFLHVASEGTRFLARVDPRTKAQAEQDISLLLDLSHLHVFDPETEAAIPLHVA